MEKNTFAVNEKKLQKTSSNYQLKQFGSCDLNFGIFIVVKIVLEDLS